MAVFHGIDDKDVTGNSPPVAREIIGIMSIYTVKENTSRLKKHSTEWEEMHFTHQQSVIYMVYF